MKKSSVRVITLRLFSVIWALTAIGCIVMINANLPWKMPTQDTKDLAWVLDTVCGLVALGAPMGIFLMLREAAKGKDDRA